MKELERRIEELIKESQKLKEKNSDIDSYPIFWVGYELGLIKGQILILRQFQERLKKGEIKWKYITKVSTLAKI